MAEKSTTDQILDFIRGGLPAALDWGSQASDKPQATQVQYTEKVAPVDSPNPPQRQAMPNYILWGGVALGAGVLLYLAVRR